MSAIRKQLDSLIASPPSIITLCGEEDFLREEAFHYLIRQLVSEETRDFNFDIVDGTEADIDTIAEMCMVVPMMADYRVVAVRHFEHISAKLKRSKNAQTGPLGKYFAAPSSSTVLVLETSSADAQQKKKKAKSSKTFPYDVLKKTGALIEFPRMSESQLPQWLKTRFKARKRDVTNDAIELLLSLTGTSLRVLNNEVEKVCTYSTDGQTISDVDIAVMTGTSREFNVFELQKAVGAKNKQRSLHILHGMLNDKAQELLILSMLHRYFLKLWILSESSPHAKSPNELASIAGVSPYFVQEYVQALRMYKPGSIEHALLTLSQAERKIKSTSTSADLILQTALVQLLG